MYQARTGLGAPYVMGNSGAIIDCGSWSNLFQLPCWNPTAQTYSMLDFTTQSDLGPAASSATRAAVAADTQATIQSQCGQDPSDCAVASSDNPDLAALQAGGQQALQNLANVFPAWAWALLIGGGALLLAGVMRR